MQEKDIIALITERDQKGLEEFISHYTPLIRYIISPILNNPSLQEECLNDIFMRVWEKIDLFEEEKGSFKSWLSVLARNTALNHLRNQKGEDNFAPGVEFTSPDESPEENAVKKENLNALKKALNTLSDKEKILVYRRYFYMQSVSQIAFELGMSERACEGKLYRIKKKLRKILGGDFDE